MGEPPSVKARKCDTFVRVRNVGLTRHVERDARASVRADTAFHFMAPTGPMEVPGFGVPIPSPAGVSDEENFGLLDDRGCGAILTFLVKRANYVIVNIST